MPIRTPAHGPARPAERPWLAMTIAIALFAGLWELVDAGLAWWDSRHEQDWAVVRQIVPLVQGRGQVQDGSWVIGLTIAPVPIRMTRDQTLRLTLRHQGRPVRAGRVFLRLRVPAMPMIDVTAVLKPGGPGTYAGQLVLPLCSTTRALWVAQVRYDDGLRPIGAGFRFAAYPPTSVLP
jgi:hypothetical protein